MSVFDDLGKGVSMMLHPWENTKKNMDIGTAYVTYYTTTVVPLVAYILVSLLLVAVAAPIFAFRHFTPFLGLGWVGAIVIPIAVVWVFIPISIFISAAVLHIVGRLTEQFRSKFDSTLVAMMYSKLPIAMFSFMLAIPFAIPFLLLFGLWSLLISLAALANQQKISWVTALGVEVIAAALAVALLGLVATIFAVSIGASIGQLVMMHYTTAVGVGAV